MSVDWFTVGAQIINFFILVWLLKKFLYKPILTAMDTRQQKIQAELEQAATLARSAEKEKITYLALQETAKEQGKEYMRQARQEADAFRKKLFQQVEAEANEAHVRWQNELAHEKVFFLKQLSAQIAGQFHCLAHNVFKDLADTNLEESIVSKFCDLIAHQQSEHDFFHQLQGTDMLDVFTAFPLTSDGQHMIQKALWLRLAQHPEISFSCNPKLLAGILVSSDNHQLEWNIHQYLDDFQNELETILAKDAH